MEENVPLETSSKNKFEKTVAGIKKLLKNQKISTKNVDKTIKKTQTAVKNDRGIVYVGHIPHGFYEDQMSSYFKQFGKVTNVRVARSKKSGRSKGYGYIEFAEKEVAEIVAETMNNYLMDKRLLKAECIPPERQWDTLFKGKSWEDKKRCPGIRLQKKAINKYNKDISHEEWIKESKKQLQKLYRTKCKLKALGIDFDFNPADIPEELISYDPSVSTSDTIKEKKNKNKKISKAKSLEDMNSNENNKNKLKMGSKQKTKKEKSMKKHSPLLKQPKLIKTSNITAADKIKLPEKNSYLKDKKGKAMNIKKESNGFNENKVVNLHKKKDFGGIQKKKIGKNKGPLSEKKKNDGKLAKAEAIKMLQSDMVKVLKQKKSFPKIDGVQSKKKKM